MGTVEAHAQDEAADEGFVEVGWVTVGVAAGIHDFDRQLGQPFHVFCGCALNGLLQGFCFGVADEFVEADSGGLAEVHGGVANSGGMVHTDGEQPVAMAEFFVAEAGFFGAEEQCDAGFGVGRCEFSAEHVADFGEGVKGMLFAAEADCGGADDEGAIGDGLGDFCELAGGFEDGGGVDGRAGPFEGDGVFIDQAQVAKAEVIHGAGDGADVVGVASADEHHAEPAEFVFAEHPLSF